MISEYTVPADADMYLRYTFDSDPLVPGKGINKMKFGAYVELADEVRENTTIF